MFVITILDFMVLNLPGGIMKFAVCVSVIGCKFCGITVIS